MSELSDALTSIEQWIAEHQPGFLETLAPGLRDAEIDDLTVDLPIQLPDDLRELYRWHNGQQGLIDYGGGFLPVYLWLSLEGGVAAYTQETQMYKSAGYFTWEENWLPVFDYEENYLIAVVGDTPKAPTHFIDFFREDPSLNVVHSSLTSMMQTLAACYKAGVFAIEELEETRFDAKKNEFVSETRYRLEFDEGEAFDIYSDHEPNIGSWWFLL